MFCTTISSGTRIRKGGKIPDGFNTTGHHRIYVNGQSRWVRSVHRCAHHAPASSSENRQVENGIPLSVVPTSDRFYIKSSYNLQAEMAKSESRNKAPPRLPTPNRKALCIFVSQENLPERQSAHPPYPTPRTTGNINIRQIFRNLRSIDVYFFGDLGRRDVTFTFLLQQLYIRKIPRRPTPSRLGTFVMSLCCI